MKWFFKAAQKAGAPPFLSTANIDRIAEGSKEAVEQPLNFPSAAFTCARKDEHGRRMPQIIAHRGFRARYPENSMLAFRGAIAAGVNAIETDVHLTKDDVVVLSHDASLKRCYGIDRKVIECDWEFVQNLTTLAAPHETMPRLQDLIELLAEPGNQHLWLLLDIKLDNDADTIMRRMAETIASVPPSQGTKWQDRILLGCWTAKFIPLAQKYFPGFPVAHIGFSIILARQFLSIENVSFNMLQRSLVSPWGKRFIKEARSKGRQVYSWTVNDAKNMDWCIRNELDGVITDDPEKFVRACETYDQTKSPKWPVRMMIDIISVNILTWIFGMYLSRKYGFGIIPKQNRIKS